MVLLALLAVAYPVYKEPMSDAAVVELTQMTEDDLKEDLQF